MSTPAIRGFAGPPGAQVHYREAGAGPVIALLHWTPLSSRQFEAVLPLLAAAGWRAIACDVPGFGETAASPEHSIASGAAVLAGAMRDLRLRDVVVMGGHSGAATAAELAIAAPDLVRLAVLDGVPVWDAARREAIKTALGPPRPDGRGFDLVTWAWNRVVHTQSVWVKDEPEAQQFVFDMFVENLRTGLPAQPLAVADWDGAARLPLVPVPVVVMGAERDTLRASFEPARELTRARASHLFPGRHPLFYPQDPGAYVDALLPLIAPG